MSTLLTVDRLAKAYGGVEAVVDVSFRLDAGELVALIGPNGAGKSTCFNMLNGQIRPDRGTIRLAGRDIAGLAPNRIGRLGVGRTFQITATFGSMTVIENVAVALLSQAGRLGRIIGHATARAEAQAAALLERVGLGAEARRAAAELAYGDLKRLELAMALANRPKLLLMDEPTAGMAPRDRAVLMRLTADLARTDGIGVLFTEHDMDVVFQHADRIMVLNRGRLIAEGRPAAVRTDPQVQAIYLGEGFAAAPAASVPSAGPPSTAASAPALPAGTAAAPILEVANLDAFYGRARILDGVAFAVAPGEVTALLGRNGAGKSTTLKAIMGLVADRRGLVRFQGVDIARIETHRIAAAGLGYVPEDRRIFAGLTVDENLEVGRRPPRDGAPTWTPERIFELFPNLAAMRRRPGGRMSGGEQQMLTIARTLMGNPLLLMLDEPSEGVAPRIVEDMARAILDLKRAGVSLLISEQNLPFARSIADRAVILERGRVRFAGSFAELDARPEIRDAHLAV